MSATATTVPDTEADFLAAAQRRIRAMVEQFAAEHPEMRRSWWEYGDG